MDNKLSSGLCDNCIHLGIMYSGNGKDEPDQIEVYCPKINSEIIPYDLQHKEMRINNCTFFTKQTH